MFFNAEISNIASHVFRYIVLPLDSASSVFPGEIGLLPRSNMVGTACGTRPRVLQANEKAHYTYSESGHFRDLVTDPG